MLLLYCFYCKFLNFFGVPEKGGVSSSTVPRNPAQTIVAALVFTTQLVNIIAFYLDLRLPHRLSYRCGKLTLFCRFYGKNMAIGELFKYYFIVFSSSEFSNGDLVGKKFNRKVAKLNANIIHLCSSQNVGPSYLYPRQTLPNLLYIFEPDFADLGR